MATSTTSGESCTVGGICSNLERPSGSGPKTDGLGKEAVSGADTKKSGLEVPTVSSIGVYSYPGGRNSVGIKTTSLILHAFNIVDQHWHRISCLIGCSEDGDVFKVRGYVDYTPVIFPDEGDKPILLPKHLCPPQPVRGEVVLRRWEKVMSSEKMWATITPDGKICYVKIPFLFEYSMTNPRIFSVL